MIFGTTYNHRNQDFSLIQKSCHARLSMFTDSEFPPTTESLYKTLIPNMNMENVVWKRAGSFFDPPPSFLNYLRTDTQQNMNRFFTPGALSNPRLSVAFMLLCENKKALQKVIPFSKNVEWPRPSVANPTDPQETYHSGVFCIHLYHFGAWRIVTVDDYLPFHDSHPLFTTSSLQNEFWPPLLEKALAKLLGNYEALVGLDLPEIMTYFTAGLMEAKMLEPVGADPSMNGCSNDYKFTETHRPSFSHLMVKLDLFQELADKELSDGNYLLLKTGTFVNTNEVGLLPNHYYVVSCMRMVNVSLEKILWIFHSSKAKVPMIRISNSGNAGDWTGPYSVGSPEWEDLNAPARESIGLTFTHEHQFWMTWLDVLNNFESVLICRDMNTSLLTLKKTWCEAIFYGRWHDRLTGGSLEYKESFLNNPQYMFDVTSPDSDDIHIQLSQNPKWNVNTALNVSGLYNIGVTVLKVENNRPYRVHSLAASSVTAYSSFENRHNIFLRHSLRQGRYVIVPSTNEPGLETDFMIRLFTSKEAVAHELVMDVPAIPACVWFVHYPVIATRIVIYNAEYLRPVSGQVHEGVNAYCVIECEGQKALTTMVSGNLHPTWEESFIFYRKHPYTHPMRISVYNNCRVIDDFLGQVVINKVEGNEGEVIKMDLVGADNVAEQALVQRGHINVEFVSYKDTDFLTI